MENELWEKFLDGDVNAWGKIFKLFYEDLYGYGLNLSNDQELTKDCINELFITIWNRRVHLSNADSVKAYLLISLRRSMLKKIKHKRRYFEDIKVETSDDYFIQTRSSPEFLIIKDETNAQKIDTLHNAIEKLSNRQKEILYLKYFNGLTYREIEQVLSINYQSVKNHMCRALKKIREIMDDEVTNITMSLFLTVFLI
jgi:RNA polymerase sigma factor (sigma-70 family)